MLRVRSAVEVVECAPGRNKIGSPVHSLSPWGGARGERHPRLNQPRAAQGGFTLGLEQGEVEADCGYLGRDPTSRCCGGVGE
jgi:hypothetical protein